jgi:hypothetical protein
MGSQGIGEKKLRMDGIRQAQARLAALEAREIELKGMALDLMREFRTDYPAGTTQAYITRSPDKSQTPLRWRLSPATPRAARRRIEITSPEGEIVLEKLCSEDRQRWLAFERRRLHINCSLAPVSYEIARLKAYMKGMREWRRVQKSTRIR